MGELNTYEISVNSVSAHVPNGTLLRVCLHLQAGARPAGEGRRRGVRRLIDRGYAPTVADRAADRALPNLEMASCSFGSICSSIVALRFSGMFPRAPS